MLHAQGTSQRQHLVRPVLGRKVPGTQCSDIVVVGAAAGDPDIQGLGKRHQHIREHSDSLALAAIAHPARTENIGDGMGFTIVVPESQDGVAFRPVRLDAHCPCRPAVAGSERAAFQRQPRAEVGRTEIDLLVKAAVRDGLQVLRLIRERIHEVVAPCLDFFP